MITKKIKKVIMEMTLYGVVVTMSASALYTVAPSYKPSRISANGNVELAMIKVPVPVDKAMEGQKVEYRIICGMRKGILECNESG
mgnify:CR=1 FL=1